jgi:hypothetical protein
MKLKLQGNLVLKTDADPINIAEDINIVDLPDGMSDAQIKEFFENFKETIKRKYAKQIFALFDVKFKEIP